MLELKELCLEVENDNKKINILKNTLIKQWKKPI
jgi:hypothetical protein